MKNVNVTVLFIQKNAAPFTLFTCLFNMAAVLTYDAAANRVSVFLFLFTTRPLPVVMCAGKKLRRNFTAETIAKRSRAFEQYLCHLCSLSALRGALCVRHFFYLTDLQAGQLLIRYITLLYDVSD